MFAYLYPMACIFYGFFRIKIWVLVMANVIINCLVIKIVELIDFFVCVHFMTRTLDQNISKRKRDTYQRLRRRDFNEFVVSVIIIQNDGVV